MLSSFGVIPKIISENICKPIHDVINVSSSICHFEFGKCGKERKKLQKFECLENKMSFLDKILKNSAVFKEISFGEKIEIWWKIADTNLKLLEFL